MKILFVAPIYYEELSPAIGVLNLATILNQSHYFASIIDFQYMYQKGTIRRYEESEKNFDEMANAIIAENPNIVGFSCMYNCYHTFIKVAERVKKNSPETKIIFGGPQASVTAIETLNKFKWIDIIMIGESEGNIIKIVDALSEKRDYIGIPSIAYRGNDVVIQNKAQNMLEDLDALPYPDYSLLPYAHELTSFPIEGGRGCPYGCIYCSTKSFWKRQYRMKSISRIISEIKTIQKTYDVHQFSFIHDLFTANRLFIIEFCNSLIKEKLDIEWFCSARIDTIDEEILQIMKSAGCKRIYFGIESGSQRMQKIINKNLKIKTVMEKVDVLKKCSMDEYVFSFIYGFPQEQIEDVNDTVKLIEHLLDKGFRSIQLHRLSILPGTEIFEKYKYSLQIKDLGESIEDVDFESCLDIIKESPLLFSYFYDHEDIQNNKLNSLEGFIANIYIPLYDVLTNTFRLIKETYGDNLINIYHVFLEQNKNFFKETCSHQKFYFSNHNSCESEVLRKLYQIKRVIENTSFGEKTSIIKDVFNFEMNLVEFVQNIETENMTQGYSCDVIRVRNRKLKIDQIKRENIKIDFLKLDRRIEIKKCERYLEVEGM